MTAPTTTRNYALDWLRVLAILTIFLFHSTRFFDPTDWHVKNAQTYPGLLIWIQFFGLWGMPLMFVVSGASTFYALGKRRPALFAIDRTLRLLVPLLFSLVTHIAAQAYLERVTHYRFGGSFLEYLPRYFTVDLYRDYFWLGFHLWYLWLLYAFSLLLAPLCVWLLHGAGERWLHRLTGALAWPGLVYLLALPIMGLTAFSPPTAWWGARVYGAWSLPPYVLFFLYGFVLVADDRVWQSVERLRWVSLLAGALLVGVLILILSGGEPMFGSPRYALMFSLLGLAAWCWVLAICGFAQRRLRVGTPALWLANEAVLPFYVLHQTVLLLVGYVVVAWAIPDPLKWAVISVGSLATILVLYWFVIRPFNPLRLLFGLKPRPTLQHAAALT